MILSELAPGPRDSWTWRLAEFSDVIPITVMADTIFGQEVTDIFTTDPRLMAYNVDLAVTEQRHDLFRQQLIVARHNQTQALMAYAWIGRGSHAPYAAEEIAEARFAHMDMSLSSSVRVRLMAQILQQWVLWCEICQIPVLVSTTIRQDQAGFLRLHERAGFLIRGSFAYKRILTKEPQ